MSVFGSDQLNAITESVDMDALVEAFAYDDISRGSEEQIKEFVNSDYAKALTEVGVFKKPTLMRLGKSDDLKRRKKLTAFELAKQANDPLWKKLKKNRQMEKKLINQIMKKYGNKADKVSKVAQKEYIKKARKSPAK